MVDFNRLRAEKQRTATHVLDCPVCGLWFADFAPLARHVASEHPSSRHAPAAQTVLDYYKPEETAPTSADIERERQAMSNDSTTIPSATRAEGSERPDYNPFLKPEHIGRGKVGAKASLALTGGARVARSQFGQQVIVEVKHGREVYDWGIKLNSPNHRLLEDQVGNDSKKWRGKSIDVEILENLGRAYIAIVEAAKPAAKSATRKAKRR